MINSTDEVMNGLSQFMASFNHTFEKVCINTFLFDGADYQLICTREVNEIRDIFKQFDIYIKESD